MNLAILLKRSLNPSPHVPAAVVRVQYRCVDGRPTLFTRRDSDEIIRYFDDIYLKIFFRITYPILTRPVTKYPLVGILEFIFIHFIPKGVNINLV